MKWTVECKLDTPWPNQIGPHRKLIESNAKMAYFDKIKGHNSKLPYAILLDNQLGIDFEHFGDETDNPITRAYNICPSIR